MLTEDIKKRLKSFASKEKAKVLQGFFKTGPGEYGEGDNFLGVVVPNIRQVSREFAGTPLDDMTELLASSVHEERLLALLMLVQAFAKGDERVKKQIYDLYLSRTRYVNNWDLVDLSAPNIVGNYLINKKRKPLYTLARSGYLWERRIAILSTFAFIKGNDYQDALKITSLLLNDEHDLIHKAVGWMLREVGKRDQPMVERYLKKHYKKMPRTMLRYAIERFPEKKRQKFLNGKA